MTRKSVFSISSVTTFWIRFLAACLGLILFMTMAQAADIKLLKTNPVSGSDYSLLDFGNNDAWSMAEMGAEFAAVRTGLNQGRDADDLWTSDSGIYIGEGGGSYRSRFLRATWETLPSSQVIEISGIIEKGDTETLKALVAANGFSRCIKPGLCPYNNTIALNSPGGNLVESLKLGEYIAQQNF
ncbi:MAG: hypothetical protein AAF408_18430, partial [Pseudomonadota bacterium]